MAGSNFLRTPRDSYNPRFGSIAPGIPQRTSPSGVNAANSAHSSHVKELIDSYSLSGVVEFVVENATKYQLSDPVVRIKQGFVEIPFWSIEPGATGKFVTRKTNDFRGGFCVTPSGHMQIYAGGSFGTASWKIAGNEDTRRIVVMWHAPSNFTSGNYMGVGISDPSYDGADLDWVDSMLRNCGEGLRESGLIFHTKPFASNCSMVRVSDGQISVEGTMGTGHHAQVHVVIQ